MLPLVLLLVLQERARIPKDIVKRMEELNAMDVEVTEYAREVYKRKVVSLS